MVLIVDGAELETTDEGFLCDWRQWNEPVALAIARLNGIEISDAHWEILLFIREYYRRFKHLPNARVFTKAVRNELGEDKGNSRYLHKLFPDGPLKFACKCAGLPKPPSCL